jgi:hypothetical protein
MATVKRLCRQARNEPLSELLRRLNPVLRGWTNYFRHGVSKATFGYLRAYVWHRVVNWLRRKHPRANWKWAPTPLPPQVVADRGRGVAVRPQRRGHQLGALPGTAHRHHAVGTDHRRVTRMT